MKWIVPLLLAGAFLHAMTADEIVTKMEDNLRGVNTYNKITMHIQTTRNTRTMEIEAWSKGSDLSFIRINYPIKDRGITFLKRDNQMWQYVPKIEKTIKIPASMMMQSWMGSGFSNDDMVRESSMSKDYYKEILSQNDTSYTLELRPKEEAAVVWGKITMEVDRKTLVPNFVDYYDEDAQLTRTLYYKDIKPIDGRYVPHTWVMQPKGEESHKAVTTVIIDAIDFNPKIEDARFTQNALKRYSK